jgi:hypothetical protein
MPVDALFESLAGAMAGWRPIDPVRRRMALAMPAAEGGNEQMGFKQGKASESARLGGRPLHTQPQDGGLKPPLQSRRAHSDRVAVSTTSNSQLVVENHPQKSPLKVLVEAFLLAFCPTCRRADIFNNERILGRQTTNPAANSVPKSAVPRFSVVCPSERLLLDLTKEARRASFHQSKSKRGIS